MPENSLAHIREKIKKWSGDGFANSVQGTLIFYFCIVVVIPLFLLGFITYSVSSRMITNKVQTYVEQSPFSL